MDIRTLLISLLIVNFFLGVFMTISLKTQKTYPGYSRWAASVLLVFIIYLLFALRGVIPDFFSVIAANSLISVVGVLRISGINRFFNRSVPKYIYLIPVIVFSLIFFFNISRTEPFINFLIVSICITFISYYIAYVYWINIREESALLFGTTIFILILYSAMSAGRAVYWYLNPEDALLMKSTIQNSLYLLLSLGVDILWATLFFTMNSYRLTAELAGKNEELRKFNNTRDKFFSIIAHDLQGPVGNISQYLEQVIQDYEKYSEEKKLTVLGKLSSSLKKTFGLLVNLLEWAKNQTGMIPFNPASISIHDAAEEVISLYRPMAEEKNITIVNSIPTSLEVNADRHMLITILRNMLSNSIKFSYSGSSVEILAAIKPDYVELIFSDSGVGIQENNIKSILTPGDFISEEGTANETGSGLGLAICREFAGRHGGEIFIKSKEKGCNISFTLPL